MNYEQLIEAIVTTVNREDDQQIRSVIPLWIRWAEASINRRLRVRQQITRAFATVTDRVLPKPTDWLASVRLWVGDDNEFSADRFASDTFPARIVGTGQPTRYTILGDAFYFMQLTGPTRVELAYYAKVPALGWGFDPWEEEGRSTNWLLQEWPDLYLYGALIHSSAHLDDDRMPKWEAMFEKVLAEAKLSDSLSYDGTIHQITAE